MDTIDNQQPGPEAGPQETPAPVPPTPQPPTPLMSPAGQPRFSYPKPKRSNAPLIIVIVVLVLALGGTIYWFTAGPGHKKDSQKGTTSSQQTNSSQNGSGSESSQSAGTKTYKSDKLGLEFTYPDTWTKKENGDKSEITVVSPGLTYTNKDGKSTQGVFTLKIRNGLLPEAMKTTIQNMVAVKDSEVIAYTKPTDQQRQYTNLSFGGNGTNMNFFMVSGSAAFKTGEVFGSSIDTQGSFYLVAGGFGTDAQDSLNFDLVPQASFTSSSVYKQAVKIVESLKVY